MSMSWLMRWVMVVRPAAVTKLRFLLPMNRWSYSTPTDQFGAKAYSKPAPTVPPQRVVLARSTIARRGRERVVAVADDGGAALEVGQETGAPAIADLTGEETETVDARAISERRQNQVAVAAFEARPIALRFNAEHPVRHLVAIADLAADRGASGVRGTLVRERRIHGNAAVREEIPSVAAGAAAGVETDIEAAPVVDRSDYRGRGLGIGPPRRKIGCEGGRRCDECKKSRRSEEKLFHF